MHTKRSTSTQKPSNAYNKYLQILPHAPDTAKIKKQISDLQEKTAQGIPKKAERITMQSDFQWRSSGLVKSCALLLWGSFFAMPNPHKLMHAPLELDFLPDSWNIHQDVSLKSKRPSLSNMSRNFRART